MHTIYIETHDDIYARTDQAQRYKNNKHKIV